MVWASEPWALLQVAPTTGVTLDKSLALPVLWSPHLDIGGERSQVFHVHHSQVCLGTPPGGEWKGQTEGTPDVRAGLHALSRHSQHPRLEGEAGVQLGGEDSRARAWLKVGAPWRGGKGPTAGATKQQQLRRGEPWGCSGDKESLWLETQRRPKEIWQNWDPE